MSLYAYSTMPPAPSDLIGAWAGAIYTMEGSAPWNISTRQNNPGNLVDPSTKTFFTYPSITAGWQALYDYLVQHIRLYPFVTFDNFMGQHYAPGSTGYGAFVVGKINAALGTNFDSSVTTLADAAAGVSNTDPVQDDPSGAYVDDNGSGNINWIPLALLGAGVTLYVAS